MAQAQNRGGSGGLGAGSRGAQALRALRIIPIGARDCCRGPSSAIFVADLGGVGSSSGRAWPGEPGRASFFYDS